MSIPEIKLACLKSFWVKNMKYIKKVFRISLLFVVLILLSGCSVNGFGVDTEPDSLKVLSPEEIESIFSEISYEITEKYPVETDANGIEIVFWFEGGSVWHISQSCSTVKKSDPTKVYSGTVQDALQNGKQRPCKICGANVEYPEFTESTTYADSELETSPVTETDKYHKEYNEDGSIRVFWLDSGKVWHESRYCSSLARSDPDKIIHGSVDDAVSAGKERVCKNCSN